MSNKNTTTFARITRYLGGRKTPATVEQVEKNLNGRCAPSTVRRALSKLALRNEVVRTTITAGGRNMVGFSLT